MYYTESTRPSTSVNFCFVLGVGILAVEDVFREVDVVIGTGVVGRQFGIESRTHLQK